MLAVGNMGKSKLSVVIACDLESEAMRGRGSVPFGNRILSLGFCHVVKPLTPILALLPAATKLGQGNVFTGVCDSVQRGGVSLSACWDATPPRSRPPRVNTPPGADTP